MLVNTFYYCHCKLLSCCTHPVFRSTACFIIRSFTINLFYIIRLSRRYFRGYGLAPILLYFGIRKYCKKGIHREAFEYKYNIFFSVSDTLENQSSILNSGLLNPENLRCTTPLKVVLSKNIVFFFVIKSSKSI